MEICTHMEFKDIVAIAGMPGLYKIVGQRQNGLIVEALDGSGKKIPTSATTKVSILSEIAMFTMDGEERLGKVLLSIFDQCKEGLAVPDKKAGDDTFPQFMIKVLPNYDNQRIYLSDMKKLANWYNILKDQYDFELLRKELTDAAKTEAEENAGDKPKIEVKAKAEKVIKNTNTKSDSKSKGKSVGTIRKMA